MGELFGWTGSILRINLTTGKTRLTSTLDYVPKFMGGRGVCDKIYWDEIPPDVRAFDPENKLIFMTGPATGTLAPESGRLHLVGKSPGEGVKPYPNAKISITDFYHSSNAGGYIGVEIKRAGYDGIIVEGKSKDPVYVYIKDDKVEFRDASHLLGLGTFDKQTIIREECGEDVITMTIGPAGENLCRYAVITSGLTDTFGSGGFGAVMGSKNLLAIAVKGTGSVKVAKPRELIDVFHTFSRTLTRKETEMVPFDAPNYDGTPTHWRGRVYIIRSANYYWSKNELEGTSLGDMVAKGLAKFKFRSCASCPICCRLSAHFKKGLDFSGTCKEIQHYALHEMAYYKCKPIGEATITHAVLLSDLGISTDYIGLFNSLKEMIEKGILTPENSGLPVDKFGSKEFVVQLFEKIAYREGIGDLLAEGLKTFMREFSKESRELYKLKYETKREPTIECKASALINLTGFDDHGQLWWNLARPGKKALIGVVHGSEEEKEILRRVGKVWFGSELALDDTTWEYKATTVRVYTYYLIVVDSLPACIWGSPAWYNLYTEDHVGKPGMLAKTYSAVTGIEATDADIRRIGERIWNLERAIMVREGRTREWDWGWTTDEGEVAQGLRKALDEYYEESGWDKATGWPTRAKLEELGLKDVADELKKLGKLP